MKRNKQITGFTLIELLMVIAIIGILAGILIPTVGAVRKQANTAASKAQLSAYVNAIQMFKGEYGYLPFVTGNSDKEVDLSSASMCRGIHGDALWAEFYNWKGTYYTHRR